MSRCLSHYSHIQVSCICSPPTIRRKMVNTIVNEIQIYTAERPHLLNYDSPDVAAKLSPLCNMQRCCPAAKQVFHTHLREI